MLKVRHYPARLNYVELCLASIRIIQWNGVARWFVPKLISVIGLSYFTRIVQA